METKLSNFFIKADNINTKDYIILKNKNEDYMIWDKKSENGKEKLSEFYNTDNETIKNLFKLHSDDIFKISNHICESNNKIVFWSQIEDEIIKNEDKDYLEDVICYKGSENVRNRKQNIDNL